jgi:hypothetical protein
MQYGVSYPPFPELSLPVLLCGSEQLGEPANSRIPHSNWEGCKMALAQVKTFLIVLLGILNWSLLVLGELWSSLVRLLPSCLPGAERLSAFCPDRMHGGKLSVSQR